MFAAISTTISLSLLAASAAIAADCRSIEFKESRFTVCEADPTTEDVRLVLDDSTGKKIATFDRLAEILANEGREIAFAMNAGMYHPDRRPVGLYIENGKQVAPIVTRSGPGNFGLLPNGVLCLTGDSARIFESREFASDPPNCRDATQSGPLLVIDGKLHPRFLPKSSSRFLRNGVGVTDTGRLIAAISDQPVTFHVFGQLFRDHLKTPNALFLDGNISRIFATDLERHDIGFPMGPMLVVSRPLN
ncbi:MAG: phosphodiester glycosidase family protein [Boseongicola sp.]